MTEPNPDWEPPTTSGWHWLQKHEQPPRPFYWNATCKEWHDSWDGSVQSIDRFSTLFHRYIAPCPVPNVEAMRKGETE